MALSFYQTFVLSLPTKDTVVFDLFVPPTDDGFFLLVAAKECNGCSVRIGRKHTVIMMSYNEKFSTL